MWSTFRPWSILLILAHVLAESEISHPQIDFSDIGGKLGVLGAFDSLSFYNAVNASSYLSSGTSLRNSSSDSNNLFLRDTDKNTSEQFASTNGQITIISPLSDSTVLVNGNFTRFNDKQCQPPIIVNVTTHEIISIFQTQSQYAKRADLPQLQSGSVKTTFVDGDLIYMGGDFKFNDTYGAAIYNITSQQLTSTPFGGFGERASVNAIAKVFDQSSENTAGSIIFGGNFTTLGVSDLLLHNITSNSTKLNYSNSTNTSIIEAEQQVSLRHGIFASVNGQGDDASLTCPKQGSSWSVTPGEGGQWSVELPNQMKGLVPTKARIYVPDGDNSVNQFRIYSYPNNGIMNLSYIDPETNDIAYCDASCPLSTISQLRKSTQENVDNFEELNEDDVFIDEQDGTFAMYYDPSTRTKTLSYGKNFQEFSFTDEIPIEKIGLTVVSWYGSNGAIAGFELYQNSLTVYGNSTLNEPNCAGEKMDNTVELTSGDWKNVHEVTDAGGISNKDYLVSVGDSKAIMYPNVTYSGDYSIIMITPGCIADNSCALRSIVNVSVIDTEGKILDTKTIYQNNDYDKFDYLYYGHLTGTTETDTKNRIEINYVSPVIPGTENPWVVLDKVRADIVELDSYYERNSTNSTSRRNSTMSELTQLKLHGLFEYSLANFSDFDITRVSREEDGEKIILKTNTFVGNSSINMLSNDLGNNTSINQLTYQDGGDQKRLIILGDLQSGNYSTTGNAITLNVDSYNETSNATVATIAKRMVYKRDSAKLFGAEFDNTIAASLNYGDDMFILGQWTMRGDNIKNLANNNASVDTAHNFVLYSGGEFYSFGNDLLDSEYDQYTNITLNSVEYFVFTAKDGKRQTWDNSKYQFVNGSQSLHISQAVNVNDHQQIISGSSFNIMNLYISDLAYTNNGQNFSAYDIDIDSNSSIILSSFFVNSSFSIIGGQFSTNNNVANVGLLNTKDNNTDVGSLRGIQWGDDAAVQALYVDNKGELLVIGTNGTSTIGDEQMSSGLLIYGLQNQSFTNFQPAALMNNNGDLNINSIVLYDSSKQLVVGGDFTNAGSLECGSLCIYDIENTRWFSPSSETSLTGVVTDMKFYTNNGVLIGGDLEFNDTTAGFVSYNLESQKYASVPFGQDRQSVEGFVFCDTQNSNLNGRLIAFGSDFLSAYNGKNWTDIEGINFTNESHIDDIKLLSVDDDSKSNSSFFGANQILALAGKINLETYGWVNVALFNGTDWIPYIFTGTEAQQLGDVRSLLVEDQYRFQSQDDVAKKSRKLSDGKVVGISLACALGTTTLLGLLFIIPYFAVFRKRNEVGSNERINEKDMVDVVNPHELLHEIDLQRNQ